MQTRRKKTCNKIYVNFLQCIMQEVPAEQMLVLIVTTGDEWESQRQETKGCRSNP